MGVKFSNNAASTLAAGISSSATSFQVASASSFPTISGSNYMYLTIGSEVVKVTATSGVTFTCDSTSSSHSAGDNVELRVTAELLNDFAEDTEALALTGGQMSGNIPMAGSQTVDGRDLSADGTKLDAIEASATADQTNAEIRAAVEAASDSNVFTDADHSKLNAVEASADVTDATNVAAAGALMDSEVTNLAAVKSFAASDYATAAQGTLAAAALAKAGGTMTGSLVTDGTVSMTGSSSGTAKIFTVASDASENYIYVGTSATKWRKQDDSANLMEINNAGTVTLSKNAVGTLTTDNDGSFAMSASNNFKCTPTGGFTLTFTSIVAQSGNILLVNSSGYTVAAHANTKVDANLLATISTAGTYLLAYFSDGTNVYMTNSAAYT